MKQIISNTEQFSLSANDTIAFEIFVDLLAFWNLPLELNKTLDFLGTLFFGVDISSCVFLKKVLSASGDFKCFITSWTFEIP